MFYTCAARFNVTENFLRNSFLIELNKALQWSAFFGNGGNTGRVCKKKAGAAEAWAEAGVREPRRQAGGPGASWESAARRWPVAPRRSQSQRLRAPQEGAGRDGLVCLSRRGRCRGTEGGATARPPPVHHYENQKKRLRSLSLSLSRGLAARPRFQSVCRVGRRGSQVHRAREGFASCFPMLWSLCVCARRSRRRRHIDDLCDWLCVCVCVGTWHPVQRFWRGSLKREKKRTSRRATSNAFYRR